MNDTDTMGSEQNDWYVHSSFPKGLSWNKTSVFFVVDNTAERCIALILVQIQKA